MLTGAWTAQVDGRSIRVGELREFASLLVGNCCDRDLDAMKAGHFFFTLRPGQGATREGRSGLSGEKYLNVMR